MRFIFTALLTFIIIVNISYTQNGWQPIYTAPVNREFSSMYFTNSITGYGVSLNDLLKTTDGGLSWGGSYTYPVNVTSVYFINENTGFVTKDYYATPPIREILKTTDSGLNWSAKYSTSYSSNRYFFTNASNGIAIGNKSDYSGVYSNILYTNNTGDSWVLANSYVGYLLSDISFKNSSTGYVSGGMPNYNNIILKTSNGGLNWSTMISNAPPLKRICFWENNKACGMSENSIYFSNNGGISWSVKINSSNLLNDMVFIDSLNGYVVGRGGTIYRTINGGLNWYPQATETNFSLSIVFFVNYLTGYISGRNPVPNSFLLKTTDGGGAVGINILSAEIPDNFSLSQNYPNPFNPVTNIQFSIPLLRGVDAGGGRGVLTKLIVFDAIGKEVQILVNEQLSPGRYQVDFNGENYTSGVYYYKLTAGDFTETKKMVLVK